MTDPYNAGGEAKRGSKQGGCLKWALIALGLLLLLGMCTAVVAGDGDDENGAATGTTEQATTEATTEPEPEPEPESADEPAPAEPDERNEQEQWAGQMAQLQQDLDQWFEGCQWDDNSNEGAAQSACREHEIGIIVSTGVRSVRGILDNIGENAPSGGFVAKDNWAVWSPQMSNVNLAWDALGADGERDQF